ncbi:MAG: NTP transferase domain-containing protein [Candidatus Cloacimonetes bacterium]|nr:NTP transferase domain-containing protein [Candidatus Cloacimonadota bacterium]
MLDLLDHIQCVIILGGKSSRFVDESSDPKPNYLIHGETWLTWQLDYVTQLGIRDVVLVLGYHFESLLDRHSFLELDQTVVFRDLKILSILNDEPDRGPFSSLQLGLKSTIAKRVLYFPVDVPAPDLSTFKNLLSVKGEYDVVKCCYEDKGGHPLLIQGAFLQSLKSDNKEDQQLNQLIRNLSPHLVCRLQTQNSDVLLNLNEPDDLERYVQNNPSRFLKLTKSFTQN